MSSKTLDTVLQYTPPGILADQSSKLLTGRRLSSGGTLGLEGSNDSAALAAQKKLEEERRAQLAQEAATRAEAKRKAETRGQSAGSSTRSSFTTGYGFGTPPSAPVSNLFGN